MLHTLTTRYQQQQVRPSYPDSDARVPSVDAASCICKCLVVLCWLVAAGLARAASCDAAGARLQHSSNDLGTQYIAAHQADGASGVEAGCGGTDASHAAARNDGGSQQSAAAVSVPASLTLCGEVENDLSQPGLATGQSPPPPPPWWDLLPKGGTRAATPRNTSNVATRVVAKGALQQLGGSRGGTDDGNNEGGEAERSAHDMFSGAPPLTKAVHLKHAGVGARGSLVPQRNLAAAGVDVLDGGEQGQDSDAVPVPPSVFVSQQQQQQRLRGSGGSVAAYLPGGSAIETALRGPRTAVRAGAAETAAAAAVARAAHCSSHGSLRRSCGDVALPTEEGVVRAGSGGWGVTSGQTTTVMAQPLRSPAKQHQAAYFWPGVRAPQSPVGRLRDSQRVHDQGGLL
jgi:hypothetical protein